ncbi:hypothetical protein [Flavobacterium sp. YO12]|uniref:hypothetical protein n=1 Tax=Flavobacterium sp. YO12 TaxID=1920029 RepID=UPI00100C1033|nr:hypothetical protein [Flavobacterium sp. YO12]RXM47597.1 hypothetical protein BOW55_10375 [Flavobacterium sp. YO12]
MAVKKSVLEQKSNKELEEYIKLDTTFVPQATKIAYEILKTRGKDFSVDEMNSINLLINKPDEKKKDLPIHSNHIKASNFIYYSAGLGVLNLFLSSELLKDKAAMISGIGALFFILLLGFLIRKGYTQIKYGLLFLSIIGLFGFIPQLIYNLQYFPINGIINLCQFILQILALVLLFMIPKDFLGQQNNTSL